MIYGTIILSPTSYTIISQVHVRSSCESYEIIDTDQVQFVMFLLSFLSGFKTILIVYTYIVVGSCCRGSRLKLNRKSLICSLPVALPS